MIGRLQTITTIFLTLYLATVIFTKVSLTGFWTDIIFSFLVCVFDLVIVFRKKAKTPLWTFVLRTLTLICSITVFGIFASSFVNPFIADTFKLRGFYFQFVNGRLFNAYFKPVGSYSGGYGNFWITESPKYFPVIEWPVYYDRTVHYNFNDDNWNGQPVDNYEVVRSYIRDQVTEKKK